MKLSFLPGGLILVKVSDEFIVTIEDEEVFRSKQEKKAIKKFNDIRRDMEEKYPATQLTLEQKREALSRLVNDRVYTQVRNSMKRPIKDKIPKTRTFG